MKYITSKDNPEIKEIVALSKPKERKKQQRFIAEGLRTCTTLFASDVPLLALYVTQEGLFLIGSTFPENPTVLVSDAVMQKISQATTPSGILGVFSLPQPPKSTALTKGLVLARLQDPGNMGTLMRSCVAFGVTSVVIIDGVDPFNAKVVQASAGTLCKLNIFIWTWEELINNKGSLTLCALVVSGGKQPSQLNLEHPLLVVGNEAEGIPAPWIAQCDEKLTLPMPGDAESLNAAVAGSIALYEMMKL